MYNLQIGQFSLHLSDVFITEAHTTFCLSYVYGHPVLQPRRLLWRQLASAIEDGAYYQFPRLMLGDMNDIKSNDEKSGGPPRAESSFEAFRT